MKTLIVGAFLAVFLLSTLMYFYGLQTGCFELQTLRILIWSNVALLSVVLLCYSRYDGTILSLFLCTFKASLLTISIVMVLINSLVLRNNPYYAISIFICGTLLATLMILVSGGRHGQLKD